MESFAAATSSRIVLAHLSAGEDLDMALRELASTHGITCAVVLSLTGALASVRLNVAREGQAPEHAPGIVEMDGFAEVMGQGVIGRVRDDWRSDAVSGIERRAGDPYVHVHLTATTSRGTICGHLLPGCIVRGIGSVSHFTVAVAALEGVTLDYHVSDEAEAAYPSGVPFYELRAAP